MGGYEAGPALIQIGNERIPVRYRAQRRRTIALHLHPGPELEVRMPRGCSAGVVRRFLDSRHDWVARKLATLPPARQFVAGALHPFLGDRYVLRLIRARTYGAELRGRALWLSLPGLDEDRVRQGLGRFYRTQAAREFGKRLDHWSGALADWGITRPPLRLRRMRRRWGSCSSYGAMTLNVRLVEFAEPLIDMVVVHELCHLLEFNHSPRFYHLMDAAMPDWRDRASALDTGQIGID